MTHASLSIPWARFGIYTLDSLEFVQRFEETCVKIETPFISIMHKENGCLPKTPSLLS